MAALFNPDLLSQSKLANKTNFNDAESWIVYEDYREALNLYQNLLKIYPDNYNYRFRIGQCYLNIPGEKAKSISFFEDAVKKINPEYKEGNFKETGAPSEALYYLANAYRINNQLDKAIDTYKQFKKILDPEVYDSTLVNSHIQSCLNAKELMKVPLYIRKINMGSFINDEKSEFNPVISEKEDLLVFSKSEAFYDAILFSVKRNNVWSTPQNMNEILKVDRDYFPTSLSKDGKDLYLYSSTDYDGIIYTTRFENGTWTPLVKLNDNINTKYWESHATVSHDNRKLYFTSNRKGTLGGLDIYVSERDSTGDWGVAVNLGPVINTEYNEESPFLSQDDKTLFFSSRGHFNIGGYDIFNSTFLDKGEWSPPLNIGYPLNTTDDDLFYNPLKEGYEGYLANYSPDGFGQLDIFRVEIFNDNHPRKFNVRGLAKLSDLMSNTEDSVKISAMNTKKSDQTVIVYSDPTTGEYEFELPHGDYQITYEANEAKKFVMALALPLTNNSDSVLLPTTTLQRTESYMALMAASSAPAAAVSEPEKVKDPVLAMLVAKKKTVKPTAPVPEIKEAPAIAPRPAIPDTVFTNIPEPVVPASAQKKGNMWLLWVAFGGLLFFFIIFWRRKKKKEEK